MQYISQFLEVEEVIILLKDYYMKKFNDRVKVEYEGIVEKLREEIIQKFVINFKLEVGVKKGFQEGDKLRSSNIFGIKNELMSYIYVKCIESQYVKKTEKIEIKITEHNQTAFELECYLNAVSVLVRYTPSKRSKSVSINELDKIIGIEHKFIAKNVHTSLTNVLINRKDDNYFRPNPKTLNNIVEIGDLGKYKSLKEKYTYIECPICGKNIKVDEDNLQKTIQVTKEAASILCQHSGTVYEQEMLYKINIAKYLENNTSKIEACMFVLNNYKKLTNKLELQPNKNKNNIVPIIELDNYRLENKYTFIEINNTKIKITEDTVTKVIEIEKDKIYICRNEPGNIFKFIKIAYINVNDLLIFIKDYEKVDSYRLRMFIVYNFVQLSKKNLLNEI